MKCEKCERLKREKMVLEKYLTEAKKMIIELQQRNKEEVN